MNTLIVTCNAGSSNVKLAAFDALSLQVIEHVTTTHQEATAWLEKLDGRRVRGFGHRVVHGRGYTAPALITDGILNELDALTPLAPLHQPHALHLIRALHAAYPGLPHIACFDTAFHHTIPRVERMIPLPEAFNAEGILRYGFHGLSYQYIASVLPSVAGEKARGRAIVLHLENGSSICGMVNLQSRAVSMGFSTLDGRMMGTRPGTLDPGVILYLLEQGRTLREVTDLLYHNSGLKGVSGVSSDMRELLADGREENALAIGLFCHLAARQLGALIMATGGVDVLVFIGGIGEHAAPVREGICRYLQWAGVAVDTGKNAANGPKISASGSAADIYVIPTNEKSVLAEAVQKLAG